MTTRRKGDEQGRGRKGEEGKGLVKDEASQRQGGMAIGGWSRPSNGQGSWWWRTGVGKEEEGKGK